MGIVISSTLKASAANSSEPLSKPRLCAEKVAGTITASTEASGYAASRADSPLTHTPWQPTALPAWWQIDAGSAVDVDYCGVAGHNLATLGCSAKVQYSTDGSTWSDASAAQVPADDDPLLFLFTQQTARYWRVYVTGSANPSVAVIQIGKATFIPRGIPPSWPPGYWNPQDKYSNQVSEGGQILGRSLRRTGVQQQITVDMLDESWADAHWASLLKAFRTNGLWFARDSLNRPDEIVYGMTSDRAQLVYSHLPSFLQMMIPLVGP